MNKNEMTERQMRVWEKAVKQMRANKEIPYEDMAEAFPGVMLRELPYPEDLKNTRIIDYTDSETGINLFVILDMGGISWYRRYKAYGAKVLSKSMISKLKNIDEYMSDRVIKNKF